MIMKKLAGLLLLTLSAFYGFAQIGEVTEVTATMSQGNQKGFKILIPESNIKDVERSWSNLMRDYDGKTTKIIKTDDYLTEQVIIPSITESALNVYVNFTETPEGVYMKAFYFNGAEYISGAGNSKASMSIRGLMKRFAKSVVLESLANQLNEEEKNLKRLEKDEKNLEKDLEGYQDDIKKAKELIEKREKDIVKNKKDTETKKSEIVTQKNKVSKLKAKLGRFK